MKLINIITIGFISSGFSAITITGSATQNGTGNTTNANGGFTDDCSNTSTHSLSTTVANATTGGEDIWQGAISTPGANDRLRFRFNEKATAADATVPPNTVTGADPTSPDFIGNASATMVVTFPLSSIGTGINGISFDHSNAPASTSDNIVWSIAWTLADGSSPGSAFIAGNSVGANGDESVLYDFSSDTAFANGNTYASGTEFYLDFNGIHDTNNQVKQGNWSLDLPDDVATLTVTARALDGAYTDNIGNEEIGADFTQAGFNTDNGCVDGLAIPVPEPSVTLLSALGGLALLTRRKK